MTSKKNIFIFGIVAILSMSLHAQMRTSTLLKDNWKFIKENVSNAEAVSFDDTSWETVSIPHDWAIAGPFIKNGNGDTGKLPWKGEGWYRTRFDLSKEIDGCGNSISVYVNQSRSCQ